MNGGRVKGGGFDEEGVDAAGVAEEDSSLSEEDESSSGFCRAREEIGGEAAAASALSESRTAFSLLSR